MQHQFFTIITKSNTHVGDGQNSYGIVDNVVQKDYNFEIPIIRSTSLKGALREYFEFKKIKDIDNIFGSKPTANDNLNQGSHYFSDAKLISYPMRSIQMQFFNVSCPLLLNDLKEDFLQVDENALVINDLDNLLNNNEVKTIAKNQPLANNNDNAIIEEHNIKIKKIDNLIPDSLKSILGENIVIMHNDTFKRLAKKLPIITRNQLENGQSKNLFYEEVVPRETRFGFVLGSDKFSDEFENISRFQIGANATVGYGFCELKKMF